MRKYDLLAMSLLMFSAVLTVGLGVIGPLAWTMPKGLSFKTILAFAQPWQTLMAALVALAAAFVAYRAAMAKVNLDREIAATVERKRKLKILLQLSYVCQVIRDEANDQLDFLEMATSSADYHALRIDEPKEVGEAWSDIDVLTRPGMNALYQIRWALRKYETNIYMLEATDDVKDLTDQVVLRREKMQAGKNLVKIREAAKTLTDDLLEQVGAINA
jgi:hypothetical protein